MAQILLVEDNSDIRELVKATLPQHSVVFASNRAAAEEAIKRTRFDMIILDVMLPDGSGFDLCADLQLADQGTTPLVFMTSKNAVSDKVFGLSLGADDYITKPIDPMEFRARVEARLRKAQIRTIQDSVITRGSLELHLLRRTATIMQANGKQEPLDLTQIEYKLLVHFAKHEGQVLSRDQLLEGVWGNSTFISDRTIDTHVSHLRKKLQDTDCALRAVYGVGYRFAVQPK